MQYLVAWFPDWPMQAAAMAGLLDDATPAALVRDRRVFVCNAAARDLGVRRGAAAHAVQALGVHTVPYDEETSASAFMTIVEAFAQVVADAEILRPGLLCVNYAVVHNFHGDAVGEALANAAAYPGLDYRFGMAPDLTTAIIAARLQTTVTSRPPEFLAEVPTRMLRDEPALACDPTVVRTLEELGLDTLGKVAQLPGRAVFARFGVAGQRCHLIATGNLQRCFQPTERSTTLSVQCQFEQPVTRVDQLIFAARRLATELQCELDAQNLACTRLHISVRSGGETYTKTWNSQQALSERDIAQRIRWQFANWTDAPVEQLILQPECSVVQPELWGGVNQQVAASLARIEGDLGIQALQPIHSGGRGVAERVTMIPYGQEHEQVTPWRGAIPKPLPARVFHPAAQVQLTDGHHVAVTVDGASLSATPAWLTWGRRTYEIQGWAGPWLVDDSWWKGGQPCARIQVQCETSAFLLTWVGNWRMEASYE